MSDVVVTVPKYLWRDWIAEGALPGDQTELLYHFWVSKLPKIEVGEFVYIVAHGRLRGYAPLVGTESSCRLRPDSACLLRAGDAVACTILNPIRGFQGWRYRWWPQSTEIPFAAWETP